MSIEYSPELKERAKKKFLEQFELLCDVGLGKIEVHFNKKIKKIDIVPSPHFGIIELPNEKNL